MMFAVHCPSHGRRLLFDDENVVSVVNRPGSGPLVLWRCSCGARGTWDPTEITRSGTREL